MVRLKGIGQRRSLSCGGVIDGMKDERIGVFFSLQTNANEILFLSVFRPVDRCNCLCCGPAVTLFVRSSAIT